MGKIVGEGSFGCIVEPEVPCDTKIDVIRTDKPKNTVSKLYFNTNIDIQNEIVMASKLHNMDPEQQYFAVPIKSCMTQIKNVIKYAPEARNCESFDPTVNMVQQLIMENEGKDLHLLFHKNKYYSINDWIRQLENILNGIQILINHKVVHQDIRLTNVTLSDKFKLLDFGISSYFDKIYTKMNTRLYADYFPYPFEYLLTSDHFTNKICMKHKIIACDNMLQFEWYDYVDSFGYRTYDNYNIFYSIEDIKKDTHSVIQWYLKNPEKWITKIKKYADRIDLYSLGTMCIDALKFMDIDELNPTAKKLYNEWIRGLIQIDVRKRFDIQQAKELYYVMKQHLSK